MNPKHVAYVLLAACLLLIFVPFAARLGLHAQRGFNPDEFEHLHAAWLTSQGQVPYRDFFEHHTPLLSFFLSPVLKAIDPASAPDRAMSAIISARQIMLGLSCLVLAATYLIGARWHNWKTGLVATVFLSNTFMFFDKTLDIRPDVLSTTFWCTSLLVLIIAVKSENQKAGRTRLFFALSGVFLGSAIMTTQKMLFAMPGYCAAMLWYLFDKRSQGDLKARLANSFIEFAGFVLPIALVCAYFAMNGAMKEFIHYNLFFNMGWKVSVPAMHRLQELIYFDTFVTLFSISGLILLLPCMFRKDQFRRGDFVLCINGLGLLAGMYIVPVPYAQYCLMFLPIMALCAAYGLIRLVDLGAVITEKLSTRASGIASALCGVCGLGLIAVFSTQLTAADNVMGPKLAALLFAGGALIAAIPYLLNVRIMAIPVLLISICVYPQVQMANVFKTGIAASSDQLTGIMYLQEGTDPTETVMDGWSGIGVFRPNADYYWMLHWEIRATLGPAYQADLLRRLKSGELNPDIVNLDADLRSLDPVITRYLERKYRSVGFGNLRAPASRTRGPVGLH